MVPGHDFDRGLISLPPVGEAVARTGHPARALMGGLSKAEVPLPLAIGSTALRTGMRWTGRVKFPSNGDGGVTSVLLNSAMVSIGAEALDCSSVNASRYPLTIWIDQLSTIVMKHDTPE